MFFNCVVFLNETLIHNSLPRNNRLTLLLPTGTWSSAARHSDAGIFIPSTETAKDHNKTLMLLFMPSIALQAVRATVSRAEMFLFWWSPHCPVLTARPAPSPLWCPLSVRLSLPVRRYPYTALPTHQIPQIYIFHSVGFCSSTGQLSPLRKRQGSSAHCSHVVHSHLGQLAFGHKKIPSTLLLPPVHRAAVAGLTAGDTSGTEKTPSQYQL